MVELAQVNGDIFYLTPYCIKKNQVLMSFLKKLSAISLLNCETHELNVPWERVWTVTCKMFSYMRLPPVPIAAQDVQGLKSKLFEWVMSTYKLCKVNMTKGFSSEWETLVTGGGAVQLCGDTLWIATDYYFWRFLGFRHIKMCLSYHMEFILTPLRIFLC